VFGFKDAVQVLFSIRAEQRANPVVADLGSNQSGHDGFLLLGKLHDEKRPGRILDDFGRIVIKGLIHHVPCDRSL